MINPVAGKVNSIPSTSPVTRLNQEQSLTATSVSALRINDSLNGQRTWRPEGPNIPHRRLAEEAAVFAIELCWTFVSHLESSTGRIQTVVQHQVSGRLQAQLLLILKWAHRGQHSEMVM